MNPKTGVVSRRLMIRWNALVFVALGSLIAAGVPIRETETAVDEQEQWQRFSERCASISLKTLSAAEADFRANDRDWGHVHDFWTTNMKDLYTMTSAEVRQPEAVRCAPIEYWDGIGTWHGNLWMLYRMCAAAQPRQADTIKLIELSIESADK